MKKILLRLLIIGGVLLLGLFGMNQDKDGSGSLDLGDLDDQFSYITDDIIQDLGGNKLTCSNGTARKVLGESCDDGDDSTTNDVVSSFGCGCQGKKQECRGGAVPGEPGSSCGEGDTVYSSDGCSCVTGVEIDGMMFATQSADERVRPTESLDEDTDRVMDTTNENDGDTDLDNDEDTSGTMNMASMTSGSGTGSMAGCSMTINCDGWLLNLAHDVPEDAPFTITDDGVELASGTFLATTNQPNAIEGIRSDAPYIPACGTRINIELTWQGGTKEIEELQMPCECAAVTAPACGEDGFDHSTDDDIDTTCSTPGDVCTAEPGTSCTYCNDACEETEIVTACGQNPGCPNPTEYCEPGQEVDESSLGEQLDANGCFLSCNTPVCVCEGTDIAPEVVGTSCDDGDADTENDVIQDDGCTCAGTDIVLICGDAGYDAGVNGCNYGETGDGIEDLTCTTIYSDTGTATSCEYCNEDCTIGTLSGEYCGDGTMQANEGEACDPADTSESNRGTATVGCSDTCEAIDDVCPGTTSAPATAGTSCDDGDTMTRDDMIQADGCTCAGEEKVYGRSTTEYGSCTVACGGGDETRVVTCTDSYGDVVDDALCTEVKPSISRTCNEQVCETYDWFVGEYSACTESCNTGDQSRTVQCRKYSDNEIVDESMCLGEKPESTMECNTHVCETFEWNVEDRSVCDATCEGGTRNRVVGCINTITKGRVASSFCTDEKPTTIEQCNTQACEEYNWRIESRNACSKACGEGEQRRTVECIDTRGGAVNRDLCTTEMPEAYKACNIQACEAYNWSAGDWSSCSHDCGGGTQTRDVECLTSSGSVTTEINCEAVMPSKSMNCNISACEEVTIDHNSGGGGGSRTRIVAFCGDGIINEQETCDDGNYLDGDGCDRYCRSEKEIVITVCGDGEMNQSSEQCDDGNFIDGDGCSRSCLIEKEQLVVIVQECGDGEINQSSEECDDGNKNNSDGCTNACKIASIVVCGDYSVDRMTEECDDGNTRNGDGCSSSCDIEEDDTIIQQILNTQSLMSTSEPFDYTSPISLPAVLPQTGVFLSPIIGITLLFLDLAELIIELIK